MSTIWSLNYHEVLEDARVLKQARVLAGAGHDVTVFSHFPEGRPKFQKLDRINIQRFAWADFASLRDSDKQAFEFLEPSCHSLLANFSTLVDQAEQLRSIEHAMAEREQLIGNLNGPVSVYKPSYYQQHSGLKRLRRKIRHKKAVRELRSKKDGETAPNLLHIDGKPPSKRHLRELKKAARESFRDLYQGKALVFAANLMREEFTGKPDVVHAHDIYTLPAGVLLAKQYSCRLIYDAHELEIARATLVGPENKEMVDLLEAACLSHVDALITVSDGIADEYRKRYSKSDPVLVLNSPVIGLTPEQAKKDKVDVRSLIGLPDDIPLLVFTGGVQREHRGLDKVVAAMAACPGVHLVVMGPRHATNDPWLCEHAEHWGVKDRLHLLDPVPADEVVGAISGGSAAIIPIQGVSKSYEMAMPNKLFEAAFARLPILVSDLPEMGKFVREHQLGIVMDHTSTEGIATAIREYLAEPQTYIQSAATQKTLNDGYSWNAQAKALTDLYDNIGE